MIPINIFLKKDWFPFRPYLTTFISKDCNILAGASGSLNELSKKLIKANNCNKNKLEKMGSLGFEYSLNFFSRKKNLSKLSRAIENIIN